jgi:hypothetical protein
MSSQSALRRICAALAIVILTCAVGWAGSGKQGQPGAAPVQPLSVSIIQLIAQPEKYDGKQVRIFGYVHFEHEGSAIYLHREDFEHGLRKNGLWLQGPESATPGSPEAAIQNHYALIEGKFVARNHGHLGLWSGAIEDVTRIIPWPPRRGGQEKPKK